MTSFSDFVLTQYAEAEEDSKTTPVYRVYNPYTNEHLLTGSLAEKNMLVNGGWSLDGIAWNAPTTGVPVYRLFNPYEQKNDHRLTASEDEAEFMTSVGWLLEGAAWYGLN